MKRKGMGKRIAAIVLAITMSISTAGFQTGIVKAEVAEGPTTVETTTTETTTAETPAESGDSAADVESADETATDSTINEGNETNDEGSIGEETTDPVITDEEATGDVVDEENADEETNGDVSEEDEITDGEEIADEELTPEELAAKLAAEEEARLAAEEEARLAAEKEAARIRAELLATSPEIISQYTEGNVTVNVQAPEGAFPGGTTVSIAPVYQTNDLVDAIDSVETTEDIVAFDITFYDIDGYEIQPRDGYTVNVSFELAAASELARDDATLQVYHIDDAQNATPVGAEIPSSSEGVEVSVEAESFSVYAITVVQDPQEFVLAGESQEVNIVLGGFTVDENNVENWFRKIFGKDPKEVIDVSYDNGEVVTAEVVGIKNGYSIFNAEWAEKAAVVTVKLTPEENAAGKSDTVHLTYDVVGIGGGNQTVSFQVSVGATHTVTFDYGYENKVDTQSVEHDSTVVKPEDPTRKGYVFLGWYKDDEKFDFDTPITADLTLTAQWKKNKVNAVNFYIQLDSVVMDGEGDIARRDVKYFSGSVANSTMNEAVDTKSFAYAGDKENAAVANSKIRGEYLGNENFVKDSPDDAKVFENLQKDAKTLKKFNELNKDVSKLTTDYYNICWYVVKYDTADGWHVDGILQPTKSTTPDPEDLNPTDPTPDPVGPTPTPGPTPDPGTTVITDDETPLAPNPGDDVDDDTTVEPTEPTDIDDEDVPLSDGTDIDDEDVPLADFPTEDDAEVTDILDEETPLSDNPMTGDSASVLWAIMAALAAFGLTAVAVTGKRKREE